ncbi:MAG: polymorphic toxin-type HINT domain-containing protein [Leptospiraceae bacterium]|nr:polymorphic toxin-type HINT domain-containing protein [Leptospiraceae bacterium]MCZ8348277.1 polymorphic toxin-type HINT domain-containing protein [Leptospiraceae bacterium]
MSPYHLSQHPTDGVRRDFVQGWTTPDERRQCEPFSSASVEFKDGNAHIRTCFTAGTLVHTKDGTKVIEDIKVGDVVMSKSDVTGEVTYKKVVNTFVRQTSAIYKVTFEDGTILETTWNHPFRRLKLDATLLGGLQDSYSEVNRSIDFSDWTKAKDLKSGDLAFTTDGKLLTISSVDVENRDETVYNFEVEDFHTYFVGESGIWVHNDDLCGAGIGMMVNNQCKGDPKCNRAAAESIRDGAAIGIVGGTIAGLATIGSFILGPQVSAAAGAWIGSRLPFLQNAGRINPNVAQQEANATREVTRKLFTESGVYQRTIGSVDITGVQSIQGNTLRINGLGAYPKDGVSKVNLGTGQMKKVFDALKSEAKEAGFDKLLVTYGRASGANKGRIVTKEIPLD